MKILYGIADGALIQRSGDGCRCTIGVLANGSLITTLGEITIISDNEYELTGIKAGGPYSITLSDDESSINLCIWVGDLWVLAGQSNMEGTGLVTDAEDYEKSHPLQYIRAYYLDNRWEAAIPVLHEPWLSVDACQRELWKQNQLKSKWHSDKPPFISHGVVERGVGPGLYFAKKMYSLTSVPQAVIPCALGGSPLDMWKPQPENGDNLYAAMLRRIKRTGGCIRGVYWNQGETDACTEESINTFEAKMIELVSAIRRDTKDEALPFVQTQIAKTNVALMCDLSSNWQRIREKQRMLEDKIDMLMTVAEIDCDLDDLIHLTADAQKIMGARAAKAMAKLCKIDGGATPPHLKSVRIFDDATRPFFGVAEIEFDNTSVLSSKGVPSGFSITKSEYDGPANPSAGIASIKLIENKVLIYTEYAKEELEKMYLHYGFKLYSYCNVENDEGFSLPAFGPVKIKDYIKGDTQ